MIYLNADELLAIAARVIGAPPLVRDHGLLESAAFRPQATVFGSDAYASIWEKTAALMESLARNHPLVDGNKRLALAAAIVFLGANGLRLVMTNDQAYDFTIKVAIGDFADVAAIANFLQPHTHPRSS